VSSSARKSSRRPRRGTRRKRWGRRLNRERAAHELERAAHEKTRRQVAVLEDEIARLRARPGLWARLKLLLRRSA
jgi:hypothetical protein